MVFEILNTQKIEKDKKIKLVEEFFDKLPEDVRREVEKYITIEILYEYYCRDEDKEDLVADDVDTLRENGCENIGARIVGRRIIGSIPYDVALKHRFFLDYCPRELIIELMKCGVIQLPEKCTLTIEWLREGSS